MQIRKTARKSVPTRKGKRKPKPDMKKKAKFILHKLIESFKASGKKPKLAFFCSADTRSSALRKEFFNFLKTRSLESNFVLYDVGLHLTEFNAFSALRLRNLLEADVVVADPVLVNSVKNRFPKAYTKLSSKAIFSLNEFGKNITPELFERLLIKSISKKTKVSG